MWHHQLLKRQKPAEMVMKASTQRADRKNFFESRATDLPQKKAEYKTRIPPSAWSLKATNRGAVVARNECGKQFEITAEIVVIVAALTGRIGLCCGATRAPR